LRTGALALPRYYLYTFFPRLQGSAFFHIKDLIDCSRIRSLRKRPKDLKFLSEDDNDPDIDEVLDGAGVIEGDPDSDFSISEEDEELVKEDEKVYKSVFSSFAKAYKNCLKNCLQNQLIGIN
jgi:hypothetical protein